MAYDVRQIKQELIHLTNQIQQDSQEILMCGSCSDNERHPILCIYMHKIGC